MRRIVPLLLIAGVAALVLYVLTGMQGMSEEPPDPISVPTKIGDFEQTYLADDKEGILNFDRQHKKRIPIKEGVKAEYTDGTVKVDLWVANGAGTTHANQMFMDMAATIGPKHEIFSQPQAVQLEGFNGYRTEGQEAVNFFLTREGRVYWIAVRGGNPDEVAGLFLRDLDLLK